MLFAVNAIVAENQLPGTPQSVWDIAGSGDTTLQGFATDISVNQGETVSFKINDTTSTSYHIDIYRMGYYGGDGARKVATIPSAQSLRIVQPAPLTDPSTGLVDAGNWAVAATWAVPSNATSGIYFARLTRDDNGAGSFILFVVRDDDGRSDLLFQTSDTTWQAYNDWGGVSFYTGPLGQNPSRAYKISYNRPFMTRTSTVGGRDFVFGEEYPMVRWLEANGYDVSYFTGVDADRYGSKILEHQGYLSVGHDEYWSGDQRANVEAARDAGVNLAFFSANEIYWKTRWETSIDASHTPYRTLVCYKETIAASKIDPMPNVWTGTWRDPRFRTPGDGGLSENALTGQIFVVNRGPGGETGTSFTVPEADGKMRLWRNTAVANLGPNQTATLGDRVLGYEWDEDRDNAFRPDGLIRMSTTTQDVPQLIDDSYVNCPFGGTSANPGGVCASCGCTVKAGTATHSLTLYRASSGALVFGAGTVQWSWGLDGTHDNGPTIPDQSMRQATVNLLADMGVQPDSLQPGLSYAAMTTDVIGPTSVITTPSSGLTLQVGAPVTISGTASDTGGGRVGGVEVSVDGGKTWRRAIGRESWSYTWTPAISGPTILLSRATDDSANIGATSSSVSVDVELTAASTTGLVAAYSFDAGSGSMLADATGQGNTGMIANATWTTSGHSGSALSFNGTNSWVTIPNAGALNPSSALTLEAWVRPTTVSGARPILFKEGSSGVPYALYSSGPSRPMVGLNTSTASAISVGAGQPLTANSWNHVAATYNGSTLLLYVNGIAVSQATGANGLISSTGALRIGGDSTLGEYFQGLIDDVRIYNRALSLAEIQADMSTPVGGALESTPPSGSISSPTPNATLVGSTTISANVSDNIGIAGVQFLLNGAPLGVEDVNAPYATSWNTPSVSNGTYVLSARIRDMAGNFTTTSGVPVNVSNPTDTTAPIVRLLTPFESTTVGSQFVLAAFASDAVGVTGVQFKANGANLGALDTKAPYRMLASLAPGVYTITATATDARGNSTTSSPVTVTVDGSAPSVAGQSPSPNATSVATDSPVAVTFNEAVLTNLNNITVTGPNGIVAGTSFYNASTDTLTFLPSSPLIPATSYNVALNGVADRNGNPLAPTSWSFTTANVLQSSFWGGAALPDHPSDPDNVPIELGLRFSSDVAGVITGVRFYKGPDNTGTHLARLWTAGGTLLATATFGSESATGWQQVFFSTPVAITANTTYVVSYYAPAGGYASSTGYFASSPSNSGNLHAPSSGGNGVYRYGAGGGFPTNSFNATNYWVDPIFRVNASDVSPPTINTRTPAANATGVSIGTTVSAKFSEAVQPATIVMTVTGPAGAVAGTVTYDSTSDTAVFTPSAPLSNQTAYTVSLSGAKDLANNTMSPVSWSFTTAAATVTASIWDASVTPSIPSSPDTDAVEVGLKFTADVAGTIAGVRFYKGPSNTGAHLGRLWTAGGTLLATATFNNESATGWQQVFFSNPVAITANTTYIVSYYAPVGGYGYSENYFASAGYNSGNLHVPSSAAAGGNGVYRYGVGGGFPNSTFNASNYWVDVLFNPANAAPDATPPTVASTNPAANANGVAAATAVAAVFSEAVQPATIVMTLTGPAGAVAGTVAYNATNNTATFTPNAPLAAQTAYTVNLSGAKDLAGNTMAPVSWSFTTAAATTFATLWDASVTPSIPSSPDTDAVEVGLKFTADVAGTIAGVRFYKGPSNTGAHLGRLWTAGGTLLATATFNNESATGWQQVFFSNPVAITANTTYIVSYYAPVGGYGYSENYFASAGYNSGNLHVPSSAAAGGNGVYRYGVGGGFPNSTFNASNYWVDVLFNPANAAPDATPPTVASTNPAANANGVAAATAVAAVFSEAVQPATIVMTLTGPAGAVAGTVAYNATNNTATFTPNAPLAAQTAYTVNLSGAKDLAGNTMAPVSWSFTTGAANAPWTESSAADFNTGTFNGTIIASPTTGGVSLASNLRDDFSGGTLGALWTRAAWGPSASATVTGGVLTVAGQEIFHNSANAVDAGVEGSVSFSNAFQHFGLATDLGAIAGNSWAVFSTMGTTNTLFARVNVNGVTQDVNLGALPTGFHTYTIQPATAGFNFLVDGVVRTTIAATMPTTANLRLALSDFNAAPSNPLRADWTRVMGGSYVSSTFDAGQTATWLTANWTATIPSGAVLVVLTSSSNDNVVWSPWAAVTNGGSIASPNGRYLRYRLVLASPDSIATPVLNSITFNRS